MRTYDLEFDLVLRIGQGARQATTVSIAQSADGLRASAVASQVDEWLMSARDELLNYAVVEPADTDESAGTMADTTAASDAGSDTTSAA